MHLSYNFCLWFGGSLTLTDLTLANKSFIHWCIGFASSCFSAISFVSLRICAQHLCRYFVYSSYADMPSQIIIPRYLYPNISSRTVLFLFWCITKNTLFRERKIHNQ